MWHGLSSKGKEEEASEALFKVTNNPFGKCFQAANLLFYGCNIYLLINVNCLKCIFKLKDPLFVGG